MRSMKQIQLAVLFLIAAAPLAGTPALAAFPPITNNLECLVDMTDPDYGASGVLTLSRMEVVGYLGGVWGGNEVPIWTANLKVACKGLTPGATYSVTTFGSWAWGSAGWLEVGVFTADWKGGGRLETQIEFLYLGDVVVSREETDGTVVPVLEGVTSRQ